MLAVAGTGVATYARALRSAQVALSPGALLLSGGAASAPDSPQSRADRVRRAARALSPLGVRAQRDRDGFVRHDLFRQAQAFFTVHGRPMPVRVPGPPGIMHWSYPVPITLAGWRNLYTVHDAIPLTRPELTAIDGTRHRRLLWCLARHAAAFVTVSQAAAGEIAAALGFPGDRVVDCSQPVEIAEAPDPALPLPAGLQAGRYLLVCGTVEPRKNVERIVTAYRAAGTGLPLAIAGPDGWRSEMTAALIRATPGVVRLPYQSRAAMIALIANARALVMPSLAEGFGLPVAEAMVLGTPVVTARGGALAETAGSAALLVDPLDIAALTAAIAAVARDDALCAALTQAGLRRAPAFSAARFIDRLRTLYDRTSAAAGT